MVLVHFQLLLVGSSHRAPPATKPAIAAAVVYTSAQLAQFHLAATGHLMWRLQGVVSTFLWIYWMF